MAAAVGMTPAPDTPSVPEGCRSTAGQAANEGERGCCPGQNGCSCHWHGPVLARRIPRLLLAERLLLRIRWLCLRLAWILLAVLIPWRLLAHDPLPCAATMPRSQSQVMCEDYLSAR